jgi:ribonuclease H2 subunit B
LFILTDFKFSCSFTILDELLENGTDDLNIITIKLPRKTSLFVVGSDGAINELVQFNERHRSFFVGELLLSNGMVYIATKIDPLFVFIQYLEQSCNDRVEPLEQILEGPAEIFIKFLNDSQMKLVADQKGPDNLKAFKYNEIKTLQWLKKKLNLIQKSLSKQKIFTSGSSSTNFVKSSSDEAVDESALMEIALEILSEYISPDLKEQLRVSNGISDGTPGETPKNKRKSDVYCTKDNSKRVKVEEQENSPSLSPPKPNNVLQKQTIKAKALEKAAKGTKSINSFFTKK